MQNLDQKMVGKTVLVTGATSGIGKITARELARMGAKVVIGGRNPQKVSDTLEEIKQVSGNAELSGLVGDLSSLAEVRRLALEFQEKNDRLDVLVNNAGAYFTKYFKSADGFEMTFALNHLAPFLLTNLLLDMLKTSAPARVVSVSSGAHSGGKMDFDDLLYEKRKYSGWQAYSQSKLANILFSNELASRLNGTQVTSNTLHPGFVATNFGRSNGGFFDSFFKMTQIFAISPEQGAQTSIFLASSQAVEGVSGKYFSQSKAVAPSQAAQNVKAGRRLWEISLKMTGLA